MTAQLVELVRVILTIPLTHADALLFAVTVIDKFEKDFGGVTYSRLPTSQSDPSPYRGSWIEKKARSEEIERAEVMRIITDVDVENNDVAADWGGRRMSVFDSDGLYVYLTSLKHLGERLLQQRVVWITVEVIDRIL